MIEFLALKLFMLWCFTILLINTVEGQSDADPVVTVKQGKLRGAKLNLLDGSTYYSFKGIRYAEVPARFSAPVPTTPWEGIRDATKHGPVCTQFDLSTQKFEEGDENCLFLNVYSRSLDPKAKHTVMVFIHGGSWQSGSGDSNYGFGPEFLLQHFGIILVTLNYRLEALGFLCLDNPEVPGNAAMKDQVAALRWVQNNIAQFGGDPNKVTLFGESAGAVSVNYHMQSRMSRGLFNKAIGESGVNIIDYALGVDGKERAFRLAKYLGKDSTDTKEVLEFLRSVPAIKLTNITHVTSTEDEKHRSLAVRFAPVVEKRFKGIEPFITLDPTEALTTGQVAKVSYMGGYNLNEAIIMLNYSMSNIETINNNPDLFVSREIVKRVSEQKTIEYGQRIKNFYSGGRDFTLNDTQEVANLLSDRYFVYDAQRYLHFYSSLSPTYLYRFSYSTELNFVKIASGYTDLKGASHADELFYIFYSPLNSDAYSKNPKLKDAVYKVTKLWTDFAKTGNPTPDNSLGVKWEPYTKTNRAYLDIDEHLTTGTDPEITRVQFWDAIHYESGIPCIGRSCTHC